MSGTNRKTKARGQLLARKERYEAGNKVNGKRVRGGGIGRALVEFSLCTA
jgi:hypothetical protein